jgi:hypothetical protein
MLEVNYNERCHEIPPPVTNIFIALLRLSYKIKIFKSEACLLRDIKKETATAQEDIQSKIDRFSERKIFYQSNQ